MTRVRLAHVVVALMASTTVASGRQEWRRNINEASVTALKTWIGAVRTHTPGRADEAVVTIAKFTYEKREDLNTGISLFLAALMGWTVDTGNNQAARWIVSEGREAGREFLKRAAVLHADVAAYGDLNPARPDADQRATQRQTRELQLGRGGGHGKLPGEPIPPLLIADRLLLSKDGEVVGEVNASWNWPFARSLLDLLGAGRQRRIFSDGKPERATDPFVSAWYHATTAYMFARGSYGDATPHLRHASMVLPDDPLALFDRGCHAEILGLPIMQVLVADASAEQRARASGTPTWHTPAAKPELRVPNLAATNAEAERLFRRALEVDPSLIEARVRLGRLLLARGRHDEAATELNTALAANPTGIVGFYAHLFAGRTQQVIGNLDQAARHFAGASAQFPDAQSALLAASQLALLRSDVPATLAPVGRLARSATSTDDPWWQYDLGAGRDADVLLKAMWARIR